MAETNFRRYTLSLDEDCLDALEHASTRTGFDKSQIVRALVFEYAASGKRVLPQVAPPHGRSIARLTLVKTNGVRSV